MRADPIGDQEVAGSISAGFGNIFLVKIDHEIFLSLPWIQEGQLLISGERMCTSIG